MSPMIDVSVALTNPQTVHKFAVLRRKQVGNDFGEPSVSVDKIPVVYGVVYPEGLNDLARRPEAQTEAKTIVVITRFALRGEAETIDGEEYQPDVVVWNGNHFLVVRVQDYSNYARGFVKVTATSTDIVDRPTSPTEAP